MKVVQLAGLLLIAVPAGAAPATKVSADAALARIVDEGLNRSEVLLNAAWLADRIGARMTNSPGARAAERWTQERFRAWGLRDVRAEGVDFGAGWSIERVEVRMTAPRTLPLRAIPIAWTPATPGAVSGEVVVAPITRERDLDAWRGRLAGKIVLVDLPTTGSEPDEPAFKRLAADDLAKFDKLDPPTVGPLEESPKWLRVIQLQARIDAFLAGENALARVRQARKDGGLLFGEGYQFAGARIPAVEIAAEDYRRLARLAKLGPVTVEVDSRVHFHTEDRQAYNILADLPGTDPKAGYVMAGGHLDTWAAADGAADNGAGVAIVLEAARILAKLDLKPRRTIRFALWTGEEQGLVGSTAYIERHVARPQGPDTSTDALGRYERWSKRFPATPLADYPRLAAYFNLDNGSGRIRGVYAEGNLAAVPRLQAMIAPLRPLGVQTVAASRSPGTDHVFLSALGLPAFQFIQDPLDYTQRTHHSSIDTYDHLKSDDLRQAATVLAWMLFAAAEAPDPLPRLPLPSKPMPTDPFGYVNPADSD